VSDLARPERAAKKRVIVLFRNEQGDRYPGVWTNCDGKREICRL
jgi:hypothetical protein